MDYVIIGGDARMAALPGLLGKAGLSAARWADGEGAGDTLKEALERARHVVANCPPRLHPQGLSLEALLNGMPGTSRLLLCGPEAPNIEDVRIVDLWRDEALLAENARLTAEGAVSAMMRVSRASLREMNCLVIGWGRIGSALAELLVAMGAKVTVASRSRSHRHRAIERGAEAISHEEMPRALSRADAVFSTPPAMVLDADMLRHVKPNALIMDLASPPYGVDLHAAWNLGLRAWREPGLPGRYCPESAARALARAILRRREDHV